MLNFHQSNTITPTVSRNWYPLLNHDPDMVRSCSFLGQCREKRDRGSIKRKSANRG